MFYTSKLILFPSFLLQFAISSSRLISVSFREASHIDFVHKKRHMDVGGWGVGACDISQ